MGSADKILFDNDSRVAPLGLIPMEGAKELGEKVNAYLVKWANEDNFFKETFLVDAECPRFSSGDGKGLIKQTVRGNDLFILCDMGNYSVKYNYFGHENYMSPDPFTAADSIAETTVNLSTAQLLCRNSRLWAFQMS